MVWEGTLTDGLGTIATLRVRIDGQEVLVEELFRAEDAHPDGEGWHECDDVGLTQDALSAAVLTLAKSP